MKYTKKGINVFLILFLAFSFLISKVYAEDALPVVSTQAATNIVHTTATLNGTVSNLGSPNPVQHGFVWSINPNPTLADNKTELGIRDATGTFFSNIAGLTSGITYYVKAYSTNFSGTVYGSEISFVANGMLLAGGNTTVVATDGSPVSISEDAFSPVQPNIRLIVSVLKDGAAKPDSIRITSVTGGEILQSDGAALTMGNVGTVLAVTGGAVNLRFTPEANRDTNASFQYVVVDPDDNSLNSPESKAVIPIAAVNDAPVLDNSGDPTLTSINEDTADSNGDLVSNIVGNSITDPDDGALEGIAITSIENDNGNWECSINGGGQWWSIANNELLAGSKSLLLQADARIRFVPDNNWNGTATITYRAWDRTFGSNRTYVDTSSNGGTTAFSTATDTASITVTAVNDAPVITDSSGGKLLHFDGSDDFVSLADTDLNESFTIEAWVKAEAANNWSRIFDFGNGSPNYNYWFGFSGATGKMGFEGFYGINNGTVYENRYTIVTEEILPLNQWMHVAAVYDETVKKGYIYWDGQLKKVGDMDYSKNPVVNRINNYFGKSNWAQDLYYKGYMRDIRVWNTALSQSEIQSKMNSILTGNENGLVVYYRVNEGSGVTLNDLAGNNHNGDISGPSWIDSNGFNFKVTTLEDTTAAISFQVTDVDTLSGNLNISASSSNTSLVPNGNLVLGGLGINRTLTITPAENFSGTTTITVMVNDGSDTTKANFPLIVKAANDAPGNPGPFTSPVADEQFKSGAAINVAWGAASDVEGDGLTYTLDFYDGTAWINNIYNGVATTYTYTNTAGLDISSAKFRVRAYDGSLYSAYVVSGNITIGSTPVVNQDTSSDSDNEEKSEQRVVGIYVGDGRGVDRVEDQVITRIVSADGIKEDHVIAENTKMESAINRAKRNQQNFVELRVSELKGDKADKVEVELFHNVINTLSGQGVTLQVSTDKGSIDLPKETIEMLRDRKKTVRMKFNKVTEQKDLQHTKQAIFNINSNGIVLGSTCIETNLSGKAKVILPLDDINIPPNKVSRERFLASLAVFVEHSDGENEMQKGEVQYDEQGNPVGISIWVEKFSTFTIVSNMDELVIVLKIESFDVYVNTIRQTIDAAPFFKSPADRVLVPTRFISETLGYNVEWLPNSRRVKITADNGDEIVLTIDSSNVICKGMSCDIDCPAEIVFDRTFVPLRFVSEELRAEVYWDSITEEITVIKPFNYNL